MNDFGFDLDEYVDNPDKCVRLLARYLNQGHLGLLLGAGASKALNLPNWEELVVSLCKKVIPKEISKDTGYTTLELKQLTEKAKQAINNQEEYLKIVQSLLYKGVVVDFSTAKKDLLIALSSLIIGKKRGNVQNVVTYNFDSILEWYLGVLGLDVNVITKEQLLARSADVNVTHIHGYLPLSNALGKTSDFLIFSQEEFEDRMMSNTDYWKEHLIEYFRRNIFLSIGMSASSLDYDVCPYLRLLDKWYSSEKIYRLQPYGVAFLTPGKDAKEKKELAEKKDKLKRSGIIPCTLEVTEIYSRVFATAQSALILSSR